jgi:hypothetical protein
MVSPERSVAKSANLIESGMRLHVLAPSGDDGVAVAAVEVSLDMTMTGAPTGIGIGIALDAMRTTMVLDEVAAADPTTIDSMVTGMAVTAVHLKILMQCPPSSNMLSLPQLHL